MPNGVNDTVIRNDSASASVFGYPYPTINLGPNITECPGVAVVLQGGTRDSLLWSNSSTNDSIVLVNGVGQYHVTVWENGCASSDTINIARHPNPPPVDLGPDTTLCLGETLLLDATASGVTYQWNDNSTNATFTVDTVGSYSVTITDGNGCESKDGINVSYFFEPSVQIFVAPGRDICLGVPVNFTAFPATQGSIAYQWVVNGSPVGSQTTDPQFKGPVEYGDSVWVELITDICSSVAYPVPSNKIEMLINPAPKTITGKVNPLENTQETYVVPLASTSSYVWRVSGGTINGDSTNNIVKIDWGAKNPNASLILKEVDAKNCERENEIAIDVVSIIGVNELDNAEIGQIYPNPSSEVVYIPVNVTGSEMIDIRLFDITGKLAKTVFSGSVSGNQLLTMSVDDLKTGMYYLELTNDKGEKSVQKLIVE